jgi:hypothetical protein
MRRQFTKMMTGIKSSDVRAMNRPSNEHGKQAILKKAREREVDR